MMAALHNMEDVMLAWQCPDYSLLFPCSISFAESFVTCLRNKAYVYLECFLAVVSTAVIQHLTSQRAMQLAQGLVIVMRKGSGLGFYANAYKPLSRGGRGSRPRSMS